MSSVENPPAFPRDHRHLGHNGMTLRDWFAGQALTGLFANVKITEQARGNADLANAAYAAADTMLVERSKAIAAATGEV